jgi:hypothetical protein
MSLARMGTGTFAECIDVGDCPFTESKFNMVESQRDKSIMMVLDLRIGHWALHKSCISLYFGLFAIRDRYAFEHRSP